MRLSVGLSYARELETLLGALRLRDGLRLLDVGCGTGLFDREALRRCPGAEVWAMDYSYSQLRRAVKLRRREGIDRLHFVHALAQEPPFADGVFDRVFTTGAMHYFGPAAVFFAAVQRVLRPDGLLVASGYLHPRYRTAPTVTARLTQKFAAGKIKMYDYGELVEAAGRAELRVENWQESGITFFLTLRRSD